MLNPDQLKNCHVITGTDMSINLSKELCDQTGVYKITNPANDNFYIGSSSVSLGRRFSAHNRLLKLNKNPCVFLQNAYNARTTDFVFEIVEVCERDQCIDREQYYLDILNPRYNICKNARSSLGRKSSEQSIKNLFEALRNFTDEDVILMFDLYNKNMKVTEIAKIVKCKPNNVSSILNKPKKYISVKEKYGLKILNKKTKYNGRFLITDPNGKEIIVDNLAKYARENNLESSNLNRCSNNIIKMCKGHKVEKLTI